MRCRLFNLLVISVCVCGINASAGLFDYFGFLRHPSSTNTVKHVKLPDVKYINAILEVSPISMAVAPLTLSDIEASPISMVAPLELSDTEVFPINTAALLTLSDIEMSPISMAVAPLKLIWVFEGYDGYYFPYSYVELQRMWIDSQYATGEITVDEMDAEYAKLQGWVDRHNKRKPITLRMRRK